MNESLNGKTVLVTGAARRVGKIFALAYAKAGANVVIHHGNSAEEAEALRGEISQVGRKAWIFKVSDKRWANSNEVQEALIFLLTCAAYISGEIIHLDGGRHTI